MQAPDYKKQEYDFRRVPNLFTQALNEETDPEALIDKALLEISKLNGEKVELQANEMRAMIEPMPEGKFKLTKQAYLKFMEECKNGDMSYIHLKHENKNSSNIVLFGASYD